MTKSLAKATTPNFLKKKKGSAVTALINNTSQSAAVKPATAAAVASAVEPVASAPAVEPVASAPAAPPATEPAAVAPAPELKVELAEVIPRKAVEETASVAAIEPSPADRGGHAKTTSMRTTKVSFEVDSDLVHETKTLAHNMYDAAGRRVHMKELVTIALEMLVSDKAKQAEVAARLSIARDAQPKSSK